MESAFLRARKDAADSKAMVKRPAAAPKKRPASADPIIPDHVKKIDMTDVFTKLKRRLTEPDISRPKFTSVASDTARRRASKKGATTDVAKAFARVNYEKASVLYAKSH